MLHFNQNANKLRTHMKITKLQRLAKTKSIQFFDFFDWCFRIEHSLTRCQ